MRAPDPPDESARLNALRRYGVVDTAAEPGFDRLTRLASHLLDMPISVITLVEEERQWFKAVIGLDAQETDRDVSFCAHAILRPDQPLVVNDVMQDPRFADNPLVLGEPNIRFYAGAPIVTPDGHGLGTLCVIDRVPREFSDDQLRVLQDLRDVAQDEFELRLVNRQRAMQAAAVDHLASGVVLSDPKLPDNPIVFCNPGFLAMTGYEEDEILGRNCRFLQGPETDVSEVERIRRAIAEQRTYRGEVLNYKKDGTPVWMELTISPIFDDEGRLMNFVGLQTDVTERHDLHERLRASSERLRELEDLRSVLG